MSRFWNVIGTGALTSLTSGGLAAGDLLGAVRGWPGCVMVVAVAAISVCPRLLRPLLAARVAMKTLEKVSSAGSLTDAGPVLKAAMEAMGAEPAPSEQSRTEPGPSEGEVPR